MVDRELPTEVMQLEKSLEAEPTSEWRHDRLLSAFCTEELEDHPRRINHIVAYIRRFPRTIQARCPFTHVDQIRCPEGFAEIEREWLALRDAHPGDADIIRGLALFVANSDPKRAEALLEGALRLEPNNHDLWTDLGRVCLAAEKRLKCFQQALRLGSPQPNLLAWSGRAAIEAENLREAQRIGEALSERALQARLQEDPRINWDDSGADAWNRLRAIAENAPDRPSLVNLVSQHANDTHWAHIILGFVAARRGDVSVAVKHLHLSAHVVGEPRLSSYGPSTVLAEELCKLEQWDDVETFLHNCKTFWQAEILDDWISDVRLRRTPNFDADSE